MGIEELGLAELLTRANKPSLSNDVDRGLQEIILSELLVLDLRPVIFSTANGDYFRLKTLQPHKRRGQESKIIGYEIVEYTTSSRRKPKSILQLDTDNNRVRAWKLQDGVMRYMGMGNDLLELAYRARNALGNR